MSDAVKIALITQLPAIISAVGVICAVVLGFINRGKISEVATKVDGKMDAMTGKVENLQGLLMGSRVDAAHAQGMKDQKETE
jgi:hypothetical protein